MHHVRAHGVEEVLVGEELPVRGDAVVGAELLQAGLVHIAERHQLGAGWLTMASALPGDAPAADDGHPVAPRGDHPSAVDLQGKGIYAHALPSLDEGRPGGPDAIFGIHGRGVKASKGEEENGSSDGSEGRERRRSGPS